MILQCAVREYKGGPCGIGYGPPGGAGTLEKYLFTRVSDESVNCIALGPPNATSVYLGKPRDGI